MLHHKDLFYAKILLFGEYSVLLDADALTVPYSYYNGALSFPSDNNYTDVEAAMESNRSLYGFLEHLRVQENAKEFDLEGMENDLHRGMFFESNIPQGYGIGSSGALVAALYSRYARNPVMVEANMTASKLKSLKKLLATLENYYHGQSSGLDPLNAYIKTPLHVQGQSIKQTRIPINSKQKEGGIFLINTQQPRQTGPLVEYFLTHTKEPGTKHIQPDKLKNLAQQSLQAFVKGEARNFEKVVRELSAFQLHFMPPMIPEGFREMWEYGLATGHYTIKLCGAGGGGFLLGFTNDMKKAEKALRRQRLKAIPVFRYSQIESIQ